MWLLFLNDSNWIYKERRASLSPLKILRGSIAAPPCGLYRTMITFRSNWMLIIYVSQVFLPNLSNLYLSPYSTIQSVFIPLQLTVTVIRMSFVCLMFSTSLAQWSVVNIFHPRLEFSYIVYNLLNVISTAHCVFKQPQALIAWHLYTEAAKLENGHPNLGIDTACSFIRNR